jgi:hypothetical protein
VQHRLWPAVDAITIENDLVRVMVAVNKGADILELMYKPAGINVLYESPWGPRDLGSLTPSDSSRTAWIEASGGGWQTLAPSAGDACIINGVEYPFHGEASMIPWKVVGQFADPTRVRVDLETRLVRSPLRMHRSLTLEAGRPILSVRNRIVNEGRVPVDLMWTEHPAFGSPFLDERCRIDSGATFLVADDGLQNPQNPLDPGHRYRWPIARTTSGSIDLSRMPEAGEERAMMAYLQGFEAGWFAISSPTHRFGVALVWPTEVFPYVWLWQVVGGGDGPSVLRDRIQARPRAFNQLAWAGSRNRNEHNGNTQIAWPWA